MMTDDELARRVFSSAQQSDSSMSMIFGVALADMSEGSVQVDIGGLSAADDAGLELPTLCDVAAGDSVAIGLYGHAGGPKKGLVLGVIGGDDTAADIAALRQRMTTLESTMSTQGQTITSVSNRVSTLEGQWGYWNLGTLSTGSQVTERGRGVYKFGEIGGKALSLWTGGNTGDYTGIVWDHNPAGYGVMLVTSPRSNNLWMLKLWAGEFDVCKVV